MKRLHIKGRVFSGSGEGAEFVRLPWVREQIVEKLDFVPYYGTLNLKLIESSVRLKRQLMTAEAIEISPVAGFCRGRCFEAYLRDNLKCAVVIPEVACYPEDVLEVVASANLRERFQLKDGDIVDVEILV